MKRSPIQQLTTCVALFSLLFIAGLCTSTNDPSPSNNNTGTGSGSGSGCTGTTASQTSDSPVLYTGIYSVEVSTLLNASKPWRTPSCSNGTADGKTPGLFASNCIRDDYVNAAIQLAWAAESYYRFGNTTQAVSYAKQAREQLNNADALCSNKPTTCATCACSTEKVWLCTGSGSGSGSGSGTGSSTTTYTVENSTLTDMAVTVGSTTKTVGSGQQGVFQGTAGTSTTYSAKTSGKTTSGSVVGLELSWSGTAAFPATGNGGVRLYVSSSYFFLKLKNTSGYSWSKVFVNYGLTSQSTDNISIPSNSTVYSIGYYKAFSNSNVRAEDTNHYWTWDSSKMGLPFTENQTTTLTGN